MMTQHLKKIIEKRLDRIANLLIINVDFVPYNGLKEGKMGICLYLFNLGIYKGDQNLFDTASDVFDKIIAEISVNDPIDYIRGLAGQGHAILNLIESGIIEGEDEDVLGNINAQILLGIKSFRSGSGPHTLISIGSYFMKIISSSVKMETENVQQSDRLISGIVSDFKIDIYDYQLLIDSIQFLSEAIFFKIHPIKAAKELYRLVEELEHTNLLSIVNLNPIRLAAIFLEVSERTDDPYYKKFAFTLVIKYEISFVESLSSSPFIVCTIALDCYRSYRRFYRETLSEEFLLKAEHWLDIALQDDEESLTGFNIERQLYNWRIFNHFANLGLELIDILKENGINRQLAGAINNYE